MDRLLHSRVVPGKLPVVYAIAVVPTCSACCLIKKEMSDCQMLYKGLGIWGALLGNLVGDTRDNLVNHLEKCRRP